MTTLIAVYTALKSASVPEKEARAAVEAIEAVNEKERLAGMEMKINLSLALHMVNLAVLSGSIFAAS